MGSVSPIVSISELYRREIGKHGVICRTRVTQGPFGKIKDIHPNGPAASRQPPTTPGLAPTARAMKPARRPRLRLGDLEDDAPNDDATPRYRGGGRTLNAGSQHRGRRH